MQFLRRNERWQQVQRAMLVLLVCVAVSLAVVFYFLYREATEQKRVADSRQLAATAQLSRSIQPDRALLLGVEAYKTSPTLEAFGALLAGVQTSPGLMAYLYPGAPVWSVAFSPDGKTLASAGGNKTGRLWDVATRRALGEPLRGHTDGIYNVAFSPDDKTLASASADHTVRLWDLDPQSWIRRTCAIVNRNLSMTEWQQYLGANVSYRKTCPLLPTGTGAPGR